MYHLPARLLMSTGPLGLCKGATIKYVGVWDFFEKKSASLG